MADSLPRAMPRRTSNSLAGCGYPAFGNRSAETDVEVNRAQAAGCHAERAMDGARPSQGRMP